jgi:hypothetical protein
MFTADSQCRPLAFSLRLGSALLLTLLSGLTPAGAADAPAPVSSSPPIKRSHEGHLTRPSALDERITLLAAELGLDAQQQAEVRKILLGQREQVQRLWNDESMASGQRIATTQAISDQTADRIRGLLTERQKKKYKTKRQAGDNAPDASSRSVEEWMSATSTGRAPLGPVQ